MDTNFKLEVAKVLAQLATPVVVGYLGWKVSKRLKDIEQLQWGNRKLTEKRIQIYEKVSPLLNRLFCYFYYVGDWQAHSPKAIVATKRELDHEMHINKYLLEPEVFSAYNDFIDSLFETYTGVGKDALIKAFIISPNGDRSKSPSFQWDNSFSDCFDERHVTAKTTVAKLYDEVMMSQRIGIKA